MQLELHNLSPADGATKRRKRIGRGQGSGRGGTSTRGHKGARSRAGYSAKIGFEGGQMPIQRRVPKFGFKNINRIEYAPVNLSTLSMLATKVEDAQFSPAVFHKYGLTAKKDLIKILGQGEVTGAFHVKAHAFSQSAIAAIEAKGGSVEIIK